MFSVLVVSQKCAFKRDIADQAIECKEDEKSDNREFHRHLEKWSDQYVEEKYACSGAHDL